MAESRAGEGAQLGDLSALAAVVGAVFFATSPDLRAWTKHRPAFAGGPYVLRPSKAGAILTELKEGRLVAARHDGLFWMWWGEGRLYVGLADSRLGCATAPIIS